MWNVQSADTTRHFGGSYRPEAETSRPPSSSGAKSAHTPGDNIAERRSSLSKTGSVCSGDMMEVYITVEVVS